jgi:hypothetical protein
LNLNSPFTSAYSFARARAPTSTLTPVFTLDNHSKGFE